MNQIEMYEKKTQKIEIPRAFDSSNDIPVKEKKAKTR